MALPRMEEGSLTQYYGEVCAGLSVGMGHEFIQNYLKDKYCVTELQVVRLHNSV
jgi:hypothetical protein